MTLTKTKPARPTKSDQRRLGRHHRVGHHYLKTYWPYLPMLAILVCGFITNSWLTSLHRSVLGYATDMSANTLLYDTNTERSAQHETPLTLSSQLDDAAQAKANDMAARNYWSHLTPDGKTPWSFITAAGYAYQSAGENLAFGFSTAQATMTAWMNSPEHRANILNNTYREVGFGVANIPNYQGHGPETLVVAMYAAPASNAVSTASAQLSAAMPASVTYQEPSAQQIARVQVMNSNVTWLLAGLILCGTGGFLLLFLRHSVAWHKSFARGEAFILRHPILDILLCALITYSVVLTRTSGIIR